MNGKYDPPNDSTNKQIDLTGKCSHKGFEIDIKTNHLEDVNRYMLEVSLKCKDCGIPFRFIGLPHGCDLNGAAVSADGTTGSFAIAPKDEVLTMVEGLTGFSSRRTQ